jgi:hypothetical protein
VAENATPGANGSKSSNTGEKLVKPGTFTKGHDPRRNLKGRPRSFDQCRELAQQIAHEELTTQSGDKLTVAEAVLRSWAKSKEPTLQKAFIEYAFGKVPDKIESTGLESKTTLVLHWPHERRDLTAAPPNGTTNGRS